MARRLGATAEQLEGIERADYAPLEASWRSALVFADAMTPTGPPPGAELFAELRSHWSDEQVVEIVAVIGVFNYFNRFAEALHIPPTT